MTSIHPTGLNPQAIHSTGSNPPAIPIKELITLSDEEITKRNPEEARHYITLREIIKSENKESTVSATPTPTNPKSKPTSPTPGPRPKRKCTEKQLAALAAGRAKNPRLKKNKDNKESETKN